MSAPFDVIPGRICTAANSNGLRLSCATYTLSSYADGTRIQFYTDSGTLPTGLSPDTTYFIRNNSNSGFYFWVSATIDGSIIPYTNSGSGTFFFRAINNRSCAVSSSTDTITSPAHGFTNGDKIQFYAGTMPGGLSENVTYFIVNATTDTFQVSATAGGSAINITSDGSDVHWCLVKTLPVTAAAATDYLTASATLPSYNQPFRITAAVLPGGLSANTTYYANPVNASTVKVMTSPFATSTIDITSSGSGVSIEYVEKNVIGVEHLPKAVIQMGRYEIGCSGYRPPPIADVIKKDTVVDGITGVLASGGGESWG